jgi:L-threonylcarbamoyladenylate synthase
MGIMQVLKLRDVLKEAGLRRRVVDGIKSGKVFVYPTDTIYGIGCNAENTRSVKRIADAKGREGGKSFSVIAPGKDWIWKHASVTKANRELIDKLLPGPYTIILTANRKSPKAVVSSEGTLGVRMPKHPFTALVEEAGVPLVTTSVNLSGQPAVRAIRDIPPGIERCVDFAVDAGIIEGYSSRIFDMRSDDVKVVRH